VAYIKFEELSSRDLSLLKKPYAGKLIVLHEEDRSSSQWGVAFTLDVEKQQISILTTNQELLRNIRQEGYAHIDQRRAGYLFSFRGAARIHSDIESLTEAIVGYEKRYEKTLQNDSDRQLVKVSIRQVYRLDLNKI